MTYTSKETNCYAIVHEALEEVERRYGTGYPDYEGGYTGGLPYHNLAHTKSVLDNFLIQAEYAELAQTERMLGSLAAAAHDIKQRKSQERETASAQWLGDKMKNAGCFSKTEIVIAQLAILGTTPLMSEGKLVGQRVNTVQYPSASAETVAKFVGCADFGDLYSAKGPLLAHDLYRELQGRAQDEVPVMKDFISFQRMQVELLESYEYPDTIGEIHKSLKKEVVSYAKQLLEHLAKGTITNWEEVRDADRNFLQSHS